MANLQSEFILAGDVGGTKVNLGVFQKGKSKPVVVSPVETFHSQTAPDLETLIEQFLQRHSIFAEIRSAAFGVAGPVVKGRVKTTHLPWCISESLLNKRFGWSRVILVNDLVATGLSIPLLHANSLKPLNQARVDRKGHIAVIAPGTGLGKALVAVDGNHMIPVASEGGHAGFAPANPDQSRLWHHLDSCFGRVSQEHVLSGTGLVNIYRWLRDKEALAPCHSVEQVLTTDEKSAAQLISQLALSKENHTCHQAMQTFIGIFGSIAGDWAMSTMARGGLYLGGGIVPQILPELCTDVFMVAYLNKGRFSEVVAKIPVRAILDDHAALLGAARLALSM